MIKFSEDKKRVTLSLHAEAPLGDGFWHEIERKVHRQLEADLRQLRNLIRPDRTVAEPFRRRRVKNEHGMEQK